MQNIETRTIENFLTDDEIEQIKLEATRLGELQPDLYGDDYHPLHGNYVCRFFKIHTDKPEFKTIADILIPKIHKEFGDDLIIESSHILYSYQPYGTHSDVMSGAYDPDIPTVPAWTFVIPLEDYDSNTIMFDQISPDIKVVREWIQKTNPPMLDTITDEFYAEYLSHTDREEARYLSVEAVFPWVKGSNFAASRSKFHTSDNYLNRGIREKVAIIIWTSVPKMDQK